MGNLSDYRPRFSFDISPAQQRRASELFVSHGQRKALMSVVLDDLLDLIEKHGQVIVGLILDGQLRPREVMPSLRRAEIRAKLSNSLEDRLDAEIKRLEENENGYDRGPDTEIP